MSHDTTAGPFDVGPASYSILVNASRMTPEQASAGLVRRGRSSSEELHGSDNEGTTPAGTRVKVVGRTARPTPIASTRQRATLKQSASIPSDIGDLEDSVVFRIELYDYDGDFDVSIPAESEVTKE